MILIGKTLDQKIYIDNILYLILAIFVYGVSHILYKMCVKCSFMGMWLDIVAAINYSSDSQAYMLFHGRYISYIKDIA